MIVLREVRPIAPLQNGLTSMDEAIKKFRDLIIPEGIDCPRAKTWMTPCIARDGATALADAAVCVGCDAEPVALLADLAERHPPARQYLGTTDADECADLLTNLVAEYVDQPSTVSGQVPNDPQAGMVAETEEED